MLSMFTRWLKFGTCCAHDEDTCGSGRLDKGLINSGERKTSDKEKDRAKTSEHHEISTRKVFMQLFPGPTNCLLLLRPTSSASKQLSAIAKKKSFLALLLGESQLVWMALLIRHVIISGR